MNQTESFVILFWGMLMSREIIWDNNVVKIKEYDNSESGKANATPKKTKQICKISMQFTDRSFVEPEEVDEVIQLGAYTNLQV